MTTSDSTMREAIERSQADRLGCFISIADPSAITADVDGPLGGMPFAVKDNIDTVDLPTTAGTGALRDSRPRADHPAVDRLKRSGAALIGKTNMHELAFGITSNNAVYGPVHNPFDLDRSAGGSSGGSAAAVASGVVPVALATDTGGSATIPAAWCGVVGFRPTTGRYGGGHTAPLSRTRDTVGLIANSVSTLIDVDGVLRTAAPVDGGIGRALGPERLRLGLPSSGYLVNLGDDVAEVWDAAKQSLVSAGVNFFEVDTAGIHELEAACGFDIVFFEVVRDLTAYLRELPVPLTLEELVQGIGSPDVAGLMAEAMGTVRTDEQYGTWLDLRRQSRAAFDRAFRDSDVDALLYPTTPVTATPLGDDLTTVLRGQEVPVFPTVTQNTLPGSDVGQPAVTVPGGIGSRGLPVGITLEGARHSDDRLLEVARVVAELVR